MSAFSGKWQNILRQLQSNEIEKASGKSSFSSWISPRAQITQVFPEGSIIAPKAEENDIRLVLVSDTHNVDIPFDRFPEGDLLLHAGDHTVHGTLEELHQAGLWLKRLARRYRFGAVTVAGNHDLPLDAETWTKEAPPSDQSIDGDGVRLLHHECLQIAGLRLFGSPFVPLTPRRRTLPPSDPRKYTGFNREDTELHVRFREIPPCDVLLTHTPAAGLLDESVQYGGVMRAQPVKIGSTVLREVLDAFEPHHRPILHVFGHEHDSRGIRFHQELGMWSANAASVEGDLGRIRQGQGYMIKPDFRAFVVDFRVSS